MELNNNTLIPDSFIIRTKPVRHVGGIFCGGVNEWDKFKSGSDVAGTWRPAWDPSLTRTTLLCVRMCSTKQSSWVYWWPAYLALRTPTNPPPPIQHQILFMRAVYGIDHQILWKPLFIELLCCEKRGANAIITHQEYLNYDLTFEGVIICISTYSVRLCLPSLYVCIEEDAAQMQISHTGVSESRPHTWRRARRYDNYHASIY